MDREERVFRKYLRAARREVQTWPAWKQNVLGPIRPDRQKNGERRK